MAKHGFSLIFRFYPFQVGLLSRLSKNYLDYDENTYKITLWKGISGNFM
jgi:hypothetical protein